MLYVHQTLHACVPMEVSLRDDVPKAVVALTTVLVLIYTFTHDQHSISHTHTVIHMGGGGGGGGGGQFMIQANLGNIPQRSTQADHSYTSPHQSM